MNEVPQKNPETNQTMVLSTMQDELSAERRFQYVGLAFNVNQLMQDGGKYQQFTRKYSTFSNKGEDTPVFLLEMDLHIAQFIEQEGYEGGKATNARIWAIYRIWNKKFKSGFILDGEIKAEYAKIDLAKKQAVELHKAVGKLAKCKADDSYEAGLKANLQNLMEETGLMQINSLLDGVERQKLLDSDGAL